MTDPWLIQYHKHLEAYKRKQALKFGIPVKPIQKMIQCQDCFQYFNPDDYLIHAETHPQNNIKPASFKIYKLMADYKTINFQIEKGEKFIPMMFILGGNWSESVCNAYLSIIFNLFIDTKNKWLILKKHRFQRIFKNTKNKQNGNNKIE
jgi:hypothetical protein